jgi:hypothetical protein
MPTAPRYGYEAYATIERVTTYYVREKFMINVRFAILRNRAGTLRTTLLLYLHNRPEILYAVVSRIRYVKRPVRRKGQFLGEAELAFP